MKKFLLILAAFLSINAFAQEQTESSNQIRLQVGYSAPSIDGNSKGGTDKGMNFKLSDDFFVTKNRNWFIGFGVNYLRSSFDNIGVDDVSADIYSLTFRSGWKASLNTKFDAWGVIECGPAYMQSRHQYHGNRFRTQSPTVVAGLEVGLDYNVSDSFALSLSCGTNKYGNNALQHGSTPSVSSSPLNFNSTQINCGFVVKF
ncbi:MAG: porin family protein [Bacteroidales bacterium]|nr:porin family protein [Bacteroidales bacterium]